MGYRGFIKEKRRWHILVAGICGLIGGAASPLCLYFLSADYQYSRNLSGTAFTFAFRALSFPAALLGLFKFFYLGPIYNLSTHELFTVCATDGLLLGACGAIGIWIFASWLNWQEENVSRKAFMSETPRNPVGLLRSSSILFVTAFLTGLLIYGASILFGLWGRWIAWTFMSFPSHLFLANGRSLMDCGQCNGNFSLCRFTASSTLYWLPALGS